MNYPWWTNGASSGFEQDNDYLHSCYDHNAFETQYEYICCNFCGDNHYIDQCPHVSTLDYVGDDFTRVQTDWHDNSFNPSWNHEHSLSWDSNASFPAYASYDQTSPSHVEEITPMHEKKLTGEEMLQCILDNQNEMRAWTKEKFNEHALALENLASQANELASTIESLKQTNVFIDISNDSHVEEAISSEHLTVGSDNVLSLVCNTFVGDCELESEEGENNIKPHAICVQNPSAECLALTDGSQVDFIGFSKYLGAIKDDFEIIELKPPMCPIESCSFQSFLIKGSCNLCMNEFPIFLKPCLLLRNEDKVIFVFDTYD